MYISEGDTKNASPQVDSVLYEFLCIGKIDIIIPGISKPVQFDSVL